MAFSLMSPFTFKTHCSSSSYASAPSNLGTSTTTARPAVILPGLGNNTGDYGKLKAILVKECGVPAVVVAKVSRIDWLRNAAGLVDPNYWRGTLKPRPVLDWYFNRINEAVLEAKELAPGGTLSLIGHSAGGWLARVYLEEFGLSDVSLLLTLGTPHLPPPKGRYLQGAPFFGKSDVEINSMVPTDSSQPSAEAVLVNDMSNSVPISKGFRARFVGQGYKQVCGRADVWGDGVVPEESAHLDGALNISLDGVYHSPVGSDDELRPWYGSPAIVEQWVQHLLS